MPDKMPTVTRSKNILFNMIALLLGILVFWILGEIGIRIIYPRAIPEVYPAMYMNDPYTGYRLKPNFTGVHRHRDFTVTYSINSSGMRDYNHPIHKPQGTYRIMVLGDSFTFGVGVPMEGTYPKVLERLLNGQNTTKRFEVINTGVPGYGTDQEYNYFVHEGIAYQPDMVIIGFLGMNNVDRVEYGWQNYSAPNGYIIKKGIKDQESIGKIREWIITHSKLALIVNYRLTKLIDSYHRHGNLREIPYQIYHDSYTKSFSKAIDRTQKYLLDLNNQNRAEHRSTVLVLIPFEMEVNKQNWIKYELEDAYSENVFNKNLLKPSTMFSAFGKENNIPTLNLVPIFRADHPEKCYFHWEAHWNTNGHLLAGQSLYSFLTATGIK